MSRQAALFSELRTKPELLTPPGFRYQENVITEAAEAALVACLQTLDLKPFEFHGHLGNRRVISFGLRYDYSRRSVEAASELPPFLNELRTQAAEFAGRNVNEFRQTGVNEYRPGAGIGWHKDKAQFGMIVGVSLLTPATMRFRRAQDRGWARVSRILAPRSMYVLSGEARTEWEHSIPPLNTLRYSITFRTLPKDASLVNV
jgi:alkylated DNA repair dioxygenase AlkB